jgi:ubiquinone/menaquinone biosynthesis C-methylase UbiE
LALERELTARAAHVSGVDPDREAITKHRTIKDIHVGTLEALPFQAGSYNLITANMVLEHLSDPGRALKEIFRVLAPSGIFLFHTPNANGYFVRVIKQIPEGIKRPAARLLEGRAGEDVYPAHYRCNSERDILNLAAASGFEVSFIRHVSTNAVFGSLLPLAIPELLWIRATMQDQRKRLRTDIIAALRKPGTA